MKNLSGAQQTIRPLFSIVFTACGGAGAAAALTIPNCEWLAWFSLSPFALLLAGRPKDPVAYFAALLGVGIFHAWSLTWICECLDGAFAFLWFFASIGLSFTVLPILFFGRQFESLRKWPLAVAFPVFWITFEYFRFWALMPLDGNGVPMLAIGQVIARYPVMLQIADIGGLAGAGWLVACVNGCVADVLRWIFFHGTSRRPLASLVVTSVVFSASCVYGTAMLDRPPGGPVVRIGLASGKFPTSVNAKSWRASNKVSTEREHLVDMAFAVWPEGSVDGRIVMPGNATRSVGANDYSANSRLASVESMAYELGCPIAVGAYAVADGNSSSPPVPVNSLLLVHPSSGLIGCYHKQHLVPFLEFSPWWSVWVRRFTVFTPLNDCHGSQRGREIKTWQIAFATTVSRHLRIAPTICYDVFFADLHRRYFAIPQAGPDVFVCAMNEGMAGSSELMMLSLRMTRFRAVEFRRPYCRASYGGITAAVDSNGTVIEERGVTATDSGFLVASVPLDDRVTLYAKWGEWLALANCACLLGGILLSCAPRIWSAKRATRTR